MKDYKGLVKFLDEEDPWGLIDMGAPPEEYFPEAKELYKIAENKVAITPEIVLEVFIRFGGGPKNPADGLQYGDRWPSITREAAVRVAEWFKD